MKHRPVALLDACVLVPMPLADTLLRLAEPSAVFEPRWSEDILAEVSRALIRRFAKAPAKARYREAAMRGFFPNAMVEGYGPLIGQMRNHPKDRHVFWPPRWHARLTTWSLSIYGTSRQWLAIQRP